MDGRREKVQVGEKRKYKRKHDREGRKKGLEKDRKGKMLGMHSLRKKKKINEILISYSQIVHPFTSIIH